MKVLISQLKARLSHYLSAVRGGKTVTVLDRKTPIARIVPVGDDGLRVEAASAPPGACRRLRGVPTQRPVDILDVLAASRGDR